MRRSSAATTLTLLAAMRHVDVAHPMCCHHFGPRRTVGGRKYSCGMPIEDATALTEGPLRSQRGAMHRRCLSEPHLQPGGGHAKAEDAP